MTTIRRHWKGVAAFALLAAGTYLGFGLAVALIVVGALLLVDRAT